MKLKNNDFKLTFALLTIVIIFTAQLSAQELSYKLEKPQKLFIGTPFKIHVDIQTAISDSIYTTQKDTLDIFILKDISTSELVNDDVKTTTVDLTYQPFDTGEFTFPELEFAVKTTDDS